MICQESPWMIIDYRLVFFSFFFFLEGWNMHDMHTLIQTFPITRPARIKLLQLHSKLSKPRMWSHWPVKWDFFFQIFSAGQGAGFGSNIRSTSWIHRWNKMKPSHGRYGKRNPEESTNFVAISLLMATKMTGLVTWTIEVFSWPFVDLFSGISWNILEPRATSNNQFPQVSTVFITNHPMEAVGVGNGGTTADSEHSSIGGDDDVDVWGMRQPLEPWFRWIQMHSPKFWCSKNTRIHQFHVPMGPIKIGNIFRG